MKDYFYKLPKAELHIHIEGALDPELMLTCAERNKIVLPYNTVEEITQAYRFHNLSEFLKVSAQGQQVLRTAQDFYDLMLSYATKAYKQGVIYAEIFFEIQSYKNLNPEIIIEGLLAGIEEAERRYPQKLYLLVCFLRNFSQESAHKALHAVIPYRERVIGIGLAGPERGNPPEKFQQVFQQAQELGLRTTAHAGEEGPSEYVQQALDILNVDRIDHGIHALDNSSLVAQLMVQHVPITVCPLSNVALNVVPSLAAHPIRRMLQAGLSVSINSDDPAYFQGYCADNYQALVREAVLSPRELVACARFSFSSSFMSESTKKEYLKRLDEFCRNHAPENF